MKQYIAIHIPAIEENSKYLLMSQMDDCNLIGSEETESGIIFYWNEEDWTSEIEHILNEAVVAYEKKIIAEENWNATWESNFDPVIIDNFCYVKAAFHPERTDFEHIIHITPKMSFGTGHHATTYQVMQLMQQMNWNNKKVFDFGTGTGILAILAEKMGASDILAIDNDPWSIDNAQENVQNNHSKNIALQLSSIDVIPQQSFDVIIANINRHILLENMEAMQKLVAQNGYIIMSGILEEDFDIIQSATAAVGLQLQSRSSKNNWLCLLFQSV